MPRTRPTLIAGNWKMYKTIEESKEFLATLAPLLEKSQGLPLVYLAVPFTAIYVAAEWVKERGVAVVIGAQNMNEAQEGSFTGEIAARMLLEAGARFVILGHSERRHLFQESNSWVNKKVKRALQAGIQAIVCIGETLQERKEGRTEEVLKEQLLGSLEGLVKEELEQIVLAYEPVWAIGTGKVAQVEEVESAHLFIRKVGGEQWGKKIANQMVIQYGGSVKPDNAKELLAQPDVDGLLIGGASLSPESFMKIIQSTPGVVS